LKKAKRTLSFENLKLMAMDEADALFLDEV
jgi:hypothetical protein